MKNDYFDDEILYEQVSDEGIREVWCEYAVVLPEDENNREFDDCYEPRMNEYDQGYDLIEIFLNKAVDAA